ncbi:hypothetical protein PAECIP111892_03823 [Paenibacillus auburnensis]|jgi:competence protein ComGC|uniref:Uncharacterized protein n=1 Tax=Paenibacillus auburnensis TaxID=2905649 RepID=A0ABM9CGK5_9BACL|nr:hypothetical protein PAECIP111892_03823 [Paenibacillus auburnensis]
MKRKMALLLSVASIVLLLAVPAYASSSDSIQANVFQPMTHGAGG